MEPVWPPKLFTSFPVSAFHNFSMVSRLEKNGQRRQSEVEYEQKV